jgi:hypothetical protein
MKGNSNHLMQIVIQSVIERFEDERHHAQVNVMANSHHGNDALVLHLTVEKANLFI